MIDKTKLLESTQVNEVEWIKQDLIKSLLLSFTALIAIVVIYALLNPTFISLFHTRG